MTTPDATPTPGVAPAGQPMTPVANAAPVAVTPTGQSLSSSQTPQAAAEPPSWKATFKDDLKGYVDTKGFKDASDVAEAYRNLEKLQGVPADKIIKLQGEMYDKDGKLTQDGRNIWERLGAPKEAKDYQLEVPKGGDPKIAEHFAQVFAENGVPKAMAERITKSFNEFSAQSGQAQQEQVSAQYQQQTVALQQEWGMAYEGNANIAKHAVRVMGIDAAKIDALASVIGHADTMKLFHKIGQSVGESPFISGQQTGGALEPAQAQAQIKALMGDTGFRQKLNNGDADAKAKWNNLHRFAYTGTIQI